MRGFSCLVAVCVLVCASGCYIPLKEPQGYSNKLQQPQFQDIPIPFKGGYEYIESASFTYVAPGSDSLRVARIKIVGDTRVDEMVKFYKRQMAIHGFELKKEFDSKTVHKSVLTFTKTGENEECTVEVWREGTDIYIELRLYPV